MEFQVPEFSEEHQKLETHKHTHTHTHTHPKQERLPVAETVKKVYQSHKYV